MPADRTGVPSLANFQKSRTTQKGRRLKMGPAFFTSILLVALAAVEAGKFGDSLRKCNVDDSASLNRCLFQVVEDLRPFMPTGIPEVNVPVLDPMLIDRIQLNQGGGPVSIRSTFSQINVRGLSRFSTKSVTADADSMQLKMKLFIPELRITGLYKTEGNVFVLPVSGEGTFWNILNNVTVDGTSSLALQGKEPNQFLKVVRNNLDFTAQKIRMRLNNLFNGDAILGETVNTFLNENAQEVVAEVKPEMSKQISELVVKVMNDALSALPAEKFLQSNRRRS